MKAGRRLTAADLDVTGVIGVVAVITYPASRAVAHWCHVADPWSWLYPVIADGLAVVAYRVTGRTRGLGRAYAWCVFVACAGLSAAGQSLHLVGLGHAPPVGLRAAVGAWPAVAAAVACHLHRVGRIRPATTPELAGAGPVTDAATDAAADTPLVEPASVAALTGHNPPAPLTVVPTAPAAGRPAATGRPSAAPKQRPTGRRSRGHAQCTGGCGQAVSPRTDRRHRERGCPTAAPTEPIAGTGEAQ